MAGNTKGLIELINRNYNYAMIEVVETQYFRFMLDHVS